MAIAADEDRRQQVLSPAAALVPVLSGDARLPGLIVSH